MTQSEQIRKNSLELLERLAGLNSQELEDLVALHNDLYFNQNVPEISDEAYDKLVEALRLVKPQSSVLRQIGAPGVAKAVAHKHPMLSLDKCYDDEAFMRWREKLVGSFVSMPKIDGVACALHYKNGHLDLALTRGDGEKGEVVTANAKVIADIPAQIEDLRDLEIRGEVYMKISRFKKLYANDFANPRNLAAGALKQKEVIKSAQYGLSFFPYDIRGADLATELEKFSFLKQLGFNTPYIEECQSLDDAHRAYKYWADEREQIDFEIDGVVFRANQVSEQLRLGNTAHHPRYAIAYKIQGESAQSELVNVIWQASRSGAITPVAIVSPVYLSGATIQRASLHNLGRFKDLALRQKSLLEIVRRGGVIPHVERVLASSGELYSIPTNCPSCGSITLVEDDFLYCSKPEQCLAALQAKALHFCSVLDLEGFGEKLILQLMETGLLKNLPDLFSLSIEKLMPLERMGQKKAQNLMDALQQKRRLRLATFLTALGISEIGPVVADILAQRFENLANLQNATKEELMQIHGIGESIADALVLGLEENRTMIAELLQYISIETATKIKGDVSHPFYNKSVVFTGTLQADRKSLQEKVRALGGLTPANVSKNLNFLVVGSGRLSSKQIQAQQLIEQGAPIQILSENEFMDLLMNG